MDELENPRPSNSSDITSMLLALTLSFACFAFVLFLLAQLAGVNQNTKNMEMQKASADKLLTKWKEAKATLDASVEKNKPVVATCEQTSNQFITMMRELDEFRRAGDKDAELIVRTFGISVNDPPPGSTPPGASSPSTPPAGEEKKDEKKAEPPKTP